MINFSLNTCWRLIPTQKKEVAFLLLPFFIGMKDVLLFCLCLFSSSLSSGCFSYRSLSCRSLSLLLATTTGTLSSLRSLSHVLVEVNKLNESHISTITKSRTKLNHAGVTTGTVSNLLCHYSVEFLQCFLVLQVAEHHAA